MGAFHPMNPTQYIDEDGWTMTCRRISWDAISWQPYEAVAVDPTGRRYGPKRAWTRRQGWKLTQKIKRRVTR